MTYVYDLTRRPSGYGAAVRRLDSKAGLASTALRLRLTAVRLYYDYLIEEGLRDINPVGRGRYTASKGFGGSASAALSLFIIGCRGFQPMMNGVACLK
ncbi:MAG: hypothetical protein H0U54_16970 [Acidobacteria bacterium]|nr:hypothetical protein [Acidobacteriota bacterium]